MTEDELETELFRLMGVARETLDASNHASATEMRIAMRSLFGVPDWDQLRIKKLDDGRVVDVLPLIGRRAHICIGPPATGVYDDVW